ncbi:MAG: RnfABCDGE type electron transport complex subunit D [Flavobacteriales bacterium]|nr:RnfABCDGE type electron transport complex subunit D [Flavobacteriales bacterium]
MQERITAFARDARHFQIVFLGGFLLFGILALDWSRRAEEVAVILGTTLATQFFFIRRLGLDIRSWKSAAITGLGLSLLLHAGSLVTLALAASLAIASKFLIRDRGKHIFNPGLFGIVLTVLLTGDAWISPGQWGTGPILLFLIAGAGSMVLLRVGRIDTGVVFLTVYMALDLVRSMLYLGWGFDVTLHRMMNGSLLLFAFFMITDPMTTPNAPRARVLWSAAIAMVAFAMGTFAYVHTAPIWALALLCALTPFFDRAFGGARFSWLAPAPFHDRAPTLNVEPTLQER